jgi:hypothetical protein
LYPGILFGSEAIRSICVAKKNIFSFLKTPCMAAFVGGLVLGITAAAVFFGIRANGERERLRERTVQVDRDLESARRSQREAQERAGRLAEELEELAGYAREIERRAGLIESELGTLAGGIDSALEHSGRIADGLGLAADSIDESRVLIDELGTILRGLSPNRGIADSAP